MSISISISAQCYIQYNYDASGNRIKRFDVGGCGKPGTGKNQDLLKVEKWVERDSTELRTESFRNDVEGQIRAYPNPSGDMIFIQVTRFESGWNYRIISLSGQIMKQSLISDNVISIDIGDMPSASYFCVIYDRDEQIIYQTKIIKL